MLQRNEFGDEASNVDDTDSPDGGTNNEIHSQNKNHDPEQTWYH